jgi:hypothetical protein
MAPLPPEHILRAALRVLFLAGVATRNWTLSESASGLHINALWEALHEVPDLLCRWHPNAEAELCRYLDEYDAQFPDLNLRAIYADALKTQLNPETAQHEDGT